MACIFLVISFIHSFFYTVNIFQKDLFQTLEHPMLKYVNLKIRMQKLLMGPWDPGSKWRHPNAGTQVPGPELSGLECSGPKCWDPLSRDPNEGTQMLGPICVPIRKVRDTLRVPKGWKLLTGPQTSEALYGSLGQRHFTSSCQFHEINFFHRQMMNYTNTFLQLYILIF